MVQQPMVQQPMVQQLMVKKPSVGIPLKVRISRKRKPDSVCSKDVGTVKTGTTDNRSKVKKTKKHDGIISHKDLMIVLEGQSIGIHNKQRDQRGSQTWNDIIKTGIIHNTRVIDIYVRPKLSIKNSTNSSKGNQLENQLENQSDNKSNKKKRNSSKCNQLENQLENQSDNKSNKKKRKEYKGKGRQFLELKTFSQHLAGIRKYFGYKSQGTKSANDQLLMYGGPYHGKTIKEYWNSLVYSEKQIIANQQFLSNNPTKIYSSAHNFISTITCNSNNYNNSSNSSD
jgi:hypothetical protein